MLDRRNFLKTSLLGAGALALGPGIGAIAASNSNIGGPRRFVFIRKSNGQRPHEFTLPSLPNQLMAKDKNKEAFEVPIGKHELPDCMHILDGDREHLTILHGLSTKMSENGHTSYQSVMGCFKSGGGNINRLKRATIDFELARLTRRLLDILSFPLPAPARALSRDIQFHIHSKRIIVTPTPLRRTKICLSQSLIRPRFIQTIECSNT